MKIQLAAWLMCAATGFAAAEFDVASVKQLDQTVAPGHPDLSFVGTAGKRIKIVGNRVTVQGTLRTLISAAYGVKDYQVSGGPSWTDSFCSASPRRRRATGPPPRSRSGRCSRPCWRIDSN